MVVDLISPKGTYDATFLANYAYINLNDQITRVPGHRQRHRFRGGPIRHALLGQARPTGQAQHHRSRDHRRHSETEHCESLPARSARSRCPTARNSPMPSAPRAAWKARRSLADRAPGQPRRLARPPERRGPHRTGGPDLQHQGALERQGPRRPGPLPAPRHQRHPGGGRGEKAHGAGQEVLSRRTWTTSLPWTPPRPCGKA